MARTYESALLHLSLLQSNRAVTSLFAPPQSTKGTASTQNLNSLAIPEMFAWLGRAGLSQQGLSQLRCIHVAGTKGKGSVCAYLTSLLTHPDVRLVAGRVGTYTSPHLVSVRERIQLDGDPISQELFTHYFFELWDAFTAAARADLNSTSSSSEELSLTEEETEGPATKPFYFRFLTIMAFYVFLKEHVRSAIIECGIGGEYDSTNILPTEAITASVVSQLGIDHVGMLGETLPEIAWHKAGVCKPGRKCFTRNLETERGAEVHVGKKVMQVLRQRADEQKALLVEVDDREIEIWGGATVQDETGETADDKSTTLEGEFQKYNQALAVNAVTEHLRILRSAPVPSASRLGATLNDLPGFIYEALGKARLRGRCETRVDEVGKTTWFIDGAHTDDSLGEVGRWFVGKLRSINGAALSPTTSPGTVPDANDATDTDTTTTTAIRTVLIFNQQDRDAPRLLRVLIDAMNKAMRPTAGVSTTTAAKGPIFDEAIFTRNELQPGQGSSDEPQRDLTVQQRLSEAMREIAPTTSTTVTDNVSDAVSKATRLPSRNAKGGEEVKLRILATGSLHLVGALLQTLEPGSDR